MKKIRVVFLEDTRADRLTLTSILKESDQFDVINYDSKIIFDDQVRNSNCDLIILDVDLHKSLGLDSDKYIQGTRIAEQIRRELPELDHVPILITSAFWDQMPITSDQYESQNASRGFFSIGKDEWGANGAKLIAKICNVLYRWPSFITCWSEPGRKEMSSRHDGFVFPVIRRQAFSR